MLVMINIINGIIVDTFQSERQKNNQLKEVKDNSCYICSIKKSKFEAQGIDFNYHINKEHNIMNYFQYILKIENTVDQADLTFIESYVLDKVSNGITDFLPEKASYSLNK